MQDVLKLCTVYVSSHIFMYFTIKSGGTGVKVAHRQNKVAHRERYIINGVMDIFKELLR